MQTDRQNPTHGRAKMLYGVVAALSLGVAASFVAAPYPAELRLQHAPTAFAVIGLLVAIHFRLLSTASTLCLIAFMILHAIGARWIYSMVPYDECSQWLTGQTLTERFGWQRNHYDRLVHLASGILFTPPAYETLRRFSKMRRFGAAIQAVAIVLAIGAAYEIIEWLIAVTMSKHDAESYNGQQGDAWDVQKDMALALIGATVTAAGLVCQRPRASRR